MGVLEKLGVTTQPLAPANCGWEIAWPAEVLEEAEGRPLKNLAGRVGLDEARGELLVTRYGLEGGLIYQLGRALRAEKTPTLFVNFKPDVPLARLAARVSPGPGEYLDKPQPELRLSGAAWAVVRHAGRERRFESPSAFAEFVQNCPILLGGLRPIAEAISSAGGVKWCGLTGALMLEQWPGLFVAGEMIDWEAPTGGYLLQGCFSTGTAAGNGAAGWLLGRENRGRSLEFGGR